MTLAAGSVLGSYRIIRLLGEGGMGCVYEAEHVGLKVRRAVKVFLTESEHGDFLRKRFAAEGRILADLQHPRIVRVYDFAVDEATGTPYFAMDLVVSPTGEPQTLEQACRNGVDEEKVAGWFRDICEGLGYIHGKGIVHRDISLDNILIDPEGRAVLTDFGIAKITGETYRRKIDVTVTMLLPVGEGLRMGKGLYMAPELKTGAQATIASDAYAVGVILFRLLVGTWYTPHARLEDALAGLECYDWSACLKGLLAEDPAQRVSLDEAAAALVPVRRQDSQGRRGLLVTLIVAVALAMAAGWIFFVGKLPIGQRAEHRTAMTLVLREQAEDFIATEPDFDHCNSFIVENLQVWGEKAIPAIVLFMAVKDDDVCSAACDGIINAYEVELGLKDVENDLALAQRIVQDVFKFLWEVEKENPVIALRAAITLAKEINAAPLGERAKEELAQAATRELEKLYEKNAKQPFKDLDAADEWCNEQEEKSDSSEEGLSSE